ncbi:hypothetical protein BCB4264_A3581 [Bacillus cereus B4264]|uniref:Uncharacterized protein n=1 Tax=Bacillus cereus (strain B4264) TaxID=405532 RepID=B7H8W7_BACC4|nr:hypothetical protein BCB4264_A3581 [Bacillus cereus B4264]
MGEFTSKYNYKNNLIKNINSPEYWYIAEMQASDVRDILCPDNQLKQNSQAKN